MRRKLLDTIRKAGPATHAWLTRPPLPRGGRRYAHTRPASSHRSAVSAR
jgi:hypothetical protein